MPNSLPAKPTIFHTEPIEIKELIAATYNPRRITAKEFNGLKNSVAKFGLVDPIIVNKDRTIIGGHMRVQAAKELNYIEVPCIVLDLSKKEEKKLNLTLNNKHIAGSYDSDMLSEVLEELKFDDDYDELRLDALEPLDLSENEEDANKEQGKVKKTRIVITLNDPTLLDDALAELIDMDFADKYDCQVKEKTT